MKFSEEFIEQVRDANNIVDVFASVTELKPSGGGRHMGLCPFPDHTEKTPSFSVNDSSQLYYCFGCKKAGNIYHAVQEMQNLNFPEAVEYLAHKAGIEIPQNMAYQKDTEQAKKRSQAWRINDSIKKFYHKNLLNLSDTHPVKAYCQKRGLTQDIIKEFELGYALDQWDTLALHLNKNKADSSICEQMGILKKRKPKPNQVANESDTYYDIFRNRLMFPVISHKEEVVGFGGRTLDDDNPPKYINSSESLVFHKSRTLYGLNKTARFIRAAGFVIVVEGYMDFLALYTQGFKNVVATMGTALTEDHARLLKRYTSRVILLFDGDEAGMKASFRSLPILLGAELMPKGLCLPNELDPDDYLKEHGAESLKEQLKMAPDLFMSFFNEVAKDYSGQATDKVYLLEQLTPALKATRDPSLRDLYLREVADRLKVDSKWVIQSVRNSLKRTTGTRSTAPSSVEGTPALEPSDDAETLIDLSQASSIELHLINLSLMKPEYLTAVIEAREHFCDKGAEELVEELASLRDNSSHKFEQFTALLVDRVQPQEVIMAHLHKPLFDMEEDEQQKSFNESMEKLKELDLKHQTKEVAKQLRDQPQSDSLKKLEQIVNIQKTRHGLKN